MKKYLMTGIAVLAICAAFTSCSKDIEPISQDDLTQFEIQKIKANYEQAFIKTFGQPAANQDWGFGNTATRSVGDYASYKGSMTPTFPSWSNFSFPKDCDAGKFLDDVPGGVKKFPANGDASATDGPFYIDSSTTRVNMWSGPGVIYVKGTVDLSGDNRFEIPQDTEIYLIKGSKLILGTNDANKLKAIIYIESTATLETANRLKMDNTSKVYNHGTIKAGAFEVNNTSFLYNVGTLDVTNGLVYLANNYSAIVNDGEIYAGEVKVEGTGNVQNNAEWYVSGNTIVNSTNATWVNNGYWKTKNYGYTAGSENVINNCYLEVTEEFDINTSSEPKYAFKIDSGGGVLTKNFNGGKNLSDPNSKTGPYKVMMGQSAVFKVTGTATLQGGNKGDGIYGPADGKYAVFQAKNVVRASGYENVHAAVTYGGQLYVSAETHFAQGNDGQADHFFIYEEGSFKVNNNIYAAGFQPGKPSVTIPTTNCCPGFDGGGDDPADLRIIAEDLSAGEGNEDFDFNDVVIDVYYGEEGYAKAKILAAGGILSLKVDGNEVHEAFSLANNNVNCTGKMINTNGTNSADAGIRSRSLDGLTAPVITLSKEVKTPAQARDNIEISVCKEVNGEYKWIELEAVVGKVASKVRVGTDYQWKDERQYVGDNFKDFVTGAAGYADWYQNE